MNRNRPQVPHYIQPQQAPPQPVPYQPMQYPQQPMMPPEQRPMMMQQPPMQRMVPQQQQPVPYQPPAPYQPSIQYQIPQQYPQQPMIPQPMQYPQQPMMQPARGMGHRNPTGNQMNPPGNQTPPRTRKSRVSTVTQPEPQYQPAPQYIDPVPMGPVRLIDTTSVEYKRGIYMNENNDMEAMPPVPSERLMGNEIYASLIDALNHASYANDACTNATIEYHIPAKHRYTDSSDGDVTTVIKILRENVSKGEAIATWYDSIITKYFNIMFSHFVETNVTVDSFFKDYDDIVEYSRNSLSHGAGFAFDKVMLVIADTIGSLHIADGDDETSISIITMKESYLILSDNLPNLDEMMSDSDTATSDSEDGGNLYLALSEFIKFSSDGVMKYILTDNHKYLVSNIQGEDRIVIAVI